MKRAKATIRFSLPMTLRYTADIHAQLGFFDQSATEIAEAIRIYREHASEHALDLANALRISALNAERRAHAAWHEAESLYASVDVQAGVARGSSITSST